MTACGAMSGDMWPSVAAATPDACVATVRSAPSACARCVVYTDVEKCIFVNVMSAYDMINATLVLDYLVASLINDHCRNPP